MTIVSNDPTLWPSISQLLFHSYFVVAAFVGVTYAWALTFGQEVELVWRQRWSLMTILYLCVRYLGMISAVLNIVSSAPTIPVTDAGCPIMYTVRNWTGFVLHAALGVIIITRLYAMYQRSRKILIFLIVIFLTVQIFSGVTVIMITMHTSGEELILSGFYQCSLGFPEDVLSLGSITWILGTVWEVLALFLAVWIAVKNFRGLRRHSAGGIMRDCFTALIKTHMIYFMSFVAVSSLNLTFFSPTILAEQSSLRIQIYYGLLQVFGVVQSSVLGPRLILGIRQYYAKLAHTDFDEATGMTSVAFQERVYISTGNGV